MCFGNPRKIPQNKKRVFLPTENFINTNKDISLKNGKSAKSSHVCLPYDELFNQPKKEETG